MATESVSLRGEGRGKTLSNPGRVIHRLGYLYRGIGSGRVSVRNHGVTGQGETARNPRIPYGWVIAPSTSDWDMISNAKRVLSHDQKLNLHGGPVMKVITGKARYYAVRPVPFRPLEPPGLWPLFVP